MDLHVNYLGGRWVHLKAPDEDLRPVCSGTHQELTVFASLVSNNHWGGILKAEDLADALLAAGVSIKDLLDDGLWLIWIDVPDLELASLRTNQKVILVDLVKVGGVLLVVNLRLDGFAARLDVDIANKYLLFGKIRNRQNCRRSLKEGLGVELYHSIAGAWLWSTYKYGCDWRLNFLSLIFLLTLLSARSSRRWSLGGGI